MSYPEELSNTTHECLKEEQLTKKQIEEIL